MGKLKFEYRMELKLSSPVTDHYFALRCVPGDSLRQTVTLTQCDVSPADYISEATDIETTAAEALRLGKGVCQDYAHIMTAVMRYMKIPARYVNGLMIGEGFTHAWVEVYVNGGWYGFDPTNDLHIDEYYIKFAHGRDYGDCTVDKGRFLGNASQKLNIFVNVEDISDDRDSRVGGTSGG